MRSGLPECSPFILRLSQVDPINCVLGHLPHAFVVYLSWSRYILVLLVGLVAHGLQSCEQDSLPSFFGVFSTRDKPCLLARWNTLFCNIRRGRGTLAIHVEFQHCPAMQDQSLFLLSDLGWHVRG